MATPARRRTRQQTSHIPGWLLGGAIAFAPFCIAMAWLSIHPVVLVLVLLGAGTAGGVGIRNRIRRREQQRIWAYQQAQIQAARAAEISNYHQMGPKQFEEAIAYLCQRDGCANAQVVGGAGDLGADVIATAPDGRHIVIQCKRYGPTHKVGSPDLQRFGGTCFTEHHAQLAVLVTTSTFTRQAAEYATRQGIRLYDNDWLAGWASRTGPAPWH